MATESAHSLIPLAYATPSLGMHPSHTLPRKLSAIASAGYTGIELGMDDLLSFAQQYLHNAELTLTSWPSLLLAAKKIRLLCAPHALNLTILTLQPLARFEGYKGAQRAAQLARAQRWAEIMDALGCGMLQIGSNDDAAASGDPADIARDLADLADAVAPRRIAYENRCGARHVRCWRQAWDVVRRADRANLGLCLDTFQIAGSEWTNPGAPGGGDDDDDDGGGKEEGSRRRRWMASLHALETLPKDKIFLLQVSDALRPPEPTSSEQWSHSLRPPPGMGGCLPVADTVAAVLATGYRGWLSVEVFLADEHGKEWCEGLGEQWAADGMRGLRAVLEECGIGEAEVVR